MIPANHHRPTQGGAHTKQQLRHNPKQKHVLLHYSSSDTLQIIILQRTLALIIQRASSRKKKDYNMIDRFLAIKLETFRFCSVFFAFPCLSSSLKTKGITKNVTAQSRAETFLATLTHASRRELLMLIQVSRTSHFPQHA
jgi:hypothetical protein